MQASLDDATDPWGVKVERVEMYVIVDVENAYRRFVTNNSISEKTYRCRQHCNAPWLPRQRHHVRHEQKLSQPKGKWNHRLRSNKLPILCARVRLHYSYAICRHWIALHPKRIRRLYSRCRWICCEDFSPINRIGFCNTILELLRFPQRGLLPFFFSLEKLRCEFDSISVLYLRLFHTYTLKFWTCWIRTCCFIN